MPLIIDAASECVSIGVLDGLRFVGTPSSGDDFAFYGRLEWPLATGLAIATSACKRSPNIEQAPARNKITN